MLYAIIETVIDLFSTALIVGVIVVGAVVVLTRLTATRPVIQTNSPPPLAQR